MFLLFISLEHYAEYLRHSSGVSVAAFVGEEDVQICCPKLLLFYYSSQLAELLKQSLPHRNIIRLPDHDPEVYLNLIYWMRNGNIDELKSRGPDADDGARHAICRSLVRLWVLVDAMMIKMPTHPSISDIRTQILDRFNDLLRTANEITTLLSQDLLLEAHRTMQPTDTSLNQLWDLMISELFSRFMQSPRPNPDQYKILFHQIPVLQIELLSRYRNYANDSDPEDGIEVPLTRPHKAIDLRPTHRFPDTSDPFADAEIHDEYSVSDPRLQGGSPATPARDYDAMSISESVDEEIPALELGDVPRDFQGPPVGLANETVQDISREHAADHDDTHHDRSSLATNDISNGISNGIPFIHSLPPAQQVERGEKRKWSSSPEPATLTKRERRW